MYKLERVGTNEIVAVKKLKENEQGDEGNSSYALREITMLKRLSSEYVIKLFEVRTYDN